ncbi:MAG: hypothetical protein ACFBSC_13770 [Microcoleaceae cyanobacterium]
MAVELKDFQTKDRIAEQSVGWLNMIAAGMIGGSFLLWSVPPFFLSRENTVHRWVQGLSLFGAILGSSTVLAIGYRLRRIEPILQAERQQEEEDFLHWLASSRYYSESLREAAVESALSEQTGIPQVLPETPAGRVIDTTAQESLGAGRSSMADWQAAQAPLEEIPVETKPKSKKSTKRKPKKTTEETTSSSPSDSTPPEIKSKRRNIPKTQRHP